MSVIQFYLEDTETLVYCIDDPTKIRFGQIENTLEVTSNLNE